MSNPAASRTILIEGWVPDSDLSLNGRRRLNPLAIWRLQEVAKTRAALAIRSIGLPLAPLHRAAVVCTFVYPQHRRRDPDNLAGLAKPLLDACRAEGLIEDDDCEHIELTVRAIVETGCTATYIHIEPLTESNPAAESHGKEENQRGRASHVVRAHHAS
jgi:Holliday junction resolvase RusA-like endonuclease